MSTDQAPKGRPSLRERRRAVAAQEIVGAAESHIVEQGPHALSLRAVARDLGMTVQALYHYFPSRDDLVTALITKAYDDLADAVRTATGAAADEPDLPGMIVAAEGYRRWAISHPERFQLLYGAPLRHYHAPVDGPTTQANRRMSEVFARELFRGCTPAQLAAADVRSLSPEFMARLKDLSPASGDPAGEGALPPPATALMLSVWGYMHGMVALEVFGHTGFLGAHQAELYRMAMRNLLEDTRRRIPPAVT
ncbi:TetR/AcrR family transcriptional regulator [Streptomyces alfalfae]|uniref:TetR/AcrR family transcriptional regulator n=1 Tax=Streptomyces alfalfae TaxID=1642299 RepID=UPI002811B831|nr:TetR/AcrR family transcriptional regulator [Streptomyces alfalfae]